MKLLFAGLAMLSATAAAQNSARTNGSSPPASTSTSAAVARAVRTSQAPVLDGRTDDAAWANASAIDQFLVYEPNTGADPRFKTEVRVLYDDRNLYVLARMHDPRPDSIVALLSRRDVRTESEQIKLVIDSYHDKRTAFQFITNPVGVKRDFYVYNDSNEDPTWDAVWDVATAIDSLGWVAEFRIPFSQMRFTDKQEHTFGLLIVRDVARTRERISWPLFRRDRQGYVSQSGELHGITDLPQPRRLELMPYAVTKNSTVPRANAFRHPQEQTGGLDLKYGLSSNVTLDATVNPDFGQVEADPAQLNLSAFEQFFGERRPFFLEGAGIFTFRASCDDVGDNTCRGLFYSRRIGRSPQLRGRYGDPASPTSSRIAAATKLSGRLGRGLSVGFLDAYTARETGTLDRTIEPGTNYLAARARQDLNGGRSDIGAMVTAVHRSLDEWSDTVLRDRAITGGVDMRHRFWSNNWELTGTVAGSTTSGTPEAMAILQRDGVHRYQRPDAPYDFDPTRTSLSGDLERVSISKWGGGITRMQSVYERVSPGFEINDLGFQRRADYQLFRNWFSLNLTKPTSLYRMAFLNFNANQQWTTDGLLIDRGVNFNWHVQMPNTWWWHLGTTVQGFNGVYDDRQTRGGPAIRRAAGGEVWGGIEGDSRWPVTPYLFAGTWRGDEWRTRGYWLDPSINFRAGSQFNGSFGISYNSGLNDSQWLLNEGAAGDPGTVYTFAQLEQRTLSGNIRANFTFTPNLTLQTYLNPFITKGDYTEWKQLGDARSANYDERFLAYRIGEDPGAFDVRELRSNTVLRWEFRPGSAAFLVWQHGRAFQSDEESAFRGFDDVRELMRQHPNNTFLLKISYWVNP
ncbi:MAG TPA: DUF5916 domain-containing protein [Gemmatimonadaceae bacterium]|nr:DUF5916 domain-containing protein [Gemmatimonadaceae bacterium]